MAPLISVLNWCYSRQELLDITLPLLMRQEGVEFEIIMGHGPGVKIPEHWTHPVIKPVFTPVLDINKAYNALWPVAKGEVLFLTQCDMQITSPTQLKRMLDKWNGRNMVTERFFKKGKRDSGMYLQCCMVGKKDMEKVGGWCELYGAPDMAGHEDGDLVATFLENGLDIERMETPFEEGVFHIDHPMPDYVGDPVMVKRLENAKKLYWSRHGEGVMSLYAKQLARKWTAKPI